MSELIGLLPDLHLASTLAAYLPFAGPDMRYVYGLFGAILGIAAHTFPDPDGLFEPSERPRTCHTETPRDGENETGTEKRTRDPEDETAHAGTIHPA